MKRITKGFMFAMVLLVVLTMAVSTPNAKAATETQINDAIAAGLNYLKNTQAAGGYWGGGWYTVACTGKAVLAFENNGHLPTGDPAADPYVDVVRKGLDYIFSQAVVQTLPVEPTGNPDTNGNGIGIYFPYGGRPVYETPMALMAIVASQAPTRTATTGPTNVNGRSYYDIAVDIVDWIAWAQSDPGTWGRGGWRYAGDDGQADNSNTQWPLLGLLTAELWGINAPAWVKSELLNYWLTYSQNLDGNKDTNYFYGCFGYTDKYTFESIAETATGILGLTYCDVLKTDPRIVAAQGYIVRDWLTTSSWRSNFGNFYAMYAVMKACRLALPLPIVSIVDYAGVPTIEWYNGVNQYADWLVAQQAGDGHWDNTAMPTYVHPDLNTAWGVLILEYVPVVVKFTLTVTVADDTTGLPIPDATVTATGPDPASPVSDTTDDEGIAELTLQAGTYDVDISKPGYESKSLTVDLVGGDVEIPPSETRLPPSVPGPGVPEFGFSVTVFTALAAALYLALKKRYTK